jgi:hypothetical protein
MLIDAGTPKEALLCVTAISHIPTDEGLYWTEFYPVDSLLELQHTDRILEGHPLLDLNPDSNINVMAEALRPAVAKKLERWCKLGYFVALRKVYLRGKSTGQVSFVRRQGSDYLTEGQLHWLEALAASGFMVYEKLAAIAAIGDFCQGLYKVVQTKQKPKRKKVKRKDRRQRELK